MKLTIYSDEKSIEESPELMKEVCERIDRIVGVGSIEIIGRTIKEYLKEDVEKIKDYVKKVKTLRCSCPEFVKLMPLALTDPVGFYVGLKRLLTRVKVEGSECRELEKKLKEFIEILSSTTLIKSVEKKLVGHEIGKRDIYKDIFHPMERSPFSQTKFITSFPSNGVLVDEYRLKDESAVRIFKLSTNEFFYHFIPPELMLSKHEAEVVKRIIERIVENEELSRAEDIREIANEFIRDMLLKEELNVREMNRLSKIILKSTVGYGVLESLLLDDNIEDIYINPGEKIFIRHAEYGECKTNIVLSNEELNADITKIRMESGRALDKANPVLDASLPIKEVKARISIATQPFSYKGISIAIRKYRKKPWTYPLFIQKKSISPLASGFLALSIQTGMSILFAGSRGSGKTSMLSASMFEMLPSNRVLVIEDTPELPVEIADKLGYNILPLKVKGSLSLAEGEISAEDGLRAALRFGDSALLVGEVRSKEARMLYEAMRVGALSNFVGGTIHAETPYGVFDRVVNDLGVPKTSFKATDLIVMMGLIKTPYTHKLKRRVLSITEVGKNWADDPLKESGFKELFTYKSDEDKLIPTKEFEKSQSLEKICKAGGLKKEEAIKLIQSIGQIKEALVETARIRKMPELLEVENVVKANMVLSRIIESDTDIDGVVESWKKEFLSKIK